MKMIYAGTEEALIPYANLLFNCNRNKYCQREFYIPVQNFSDLVLYLDFPGEPETIDIQIIDVCDPESVFTATSSLYVAGTKPDGSWYGVFGSLTVEPNTLKRFFIKISVLVAGVTYIYYSQQIEIPVCDPLMLLQSCYPLKEIGVDTDDCNGIYYGQPNNPDDALGSITYRYVHTAFVRMGSVTEQKNRMTFTAFNSKKTYKSVLTRESLLEFELVPTFYKDQLLGIFNRGNIEVAGVKWKLAESQDISMIDKDSKLWRMDILLDEECRQPFGCASLDCLNFDVSVESVECDQEYSGDLTALIAQLSACPGAVFELLTWNNTYLTAAPVINPDGTFSFTMLNSISAIPVTLFTFKVTCSNGQVITANYIAREVVCESCVDVTIEDTDIPDGQVGVAYNGTITLGGTSPFAIFLIDTPSWMIVTLIGNVIYLSGTPTDEDTDLPVKIQVTNCEEGDVTVDETIDIAAAAACTLYTFTAGDAGATIKYLACVSGDEETLILFANQTGARCARTGTALVDTGSATIEDFGPCVG